MKKFAVVTALEGVAEARKAWTTRRREFDDGLTYVMNRLIHEAAVNFMSVGDIAKASGLTRKRVIDLMHANGLRTSMGKRLLAETAAEALATNSALLGIDPHEMDLMSPLAYLPMGSKMRAFLETPVDVDEALGEEGVSEERVRQMVIALVGKHGTKADVGAVAADTILLMEGVLDVSPSGELVLAAHNRPLSASDAT